MKVLLLGGTGAMGVPLQKHLVKQGHEVHVTSRSQRKSDEIIFHQGDGHDISFVSELLHHHFDVIIDFMSYKTDEFVSRLKQFLDTTSQYVFISSARVYAPSDSVLTEESERLLDVCTDKDYLQTDEYALAKAREENCLFNSGRKNYTIVRPGITYYNSRLQYYLGEKEEWLFRYLNNKRIVMPKDCCNIFTTMTNGDEVAYAISLLVGNERAIGETVHIAGATAVTWEEVNSIYSKVLVSRFGRAPEYYYVDDWEKIGKSLGRYYQLKYARGVSRRFDNSKLESIIGNISFSDPHEGLSLCLNNFIDAKCEVKGWWRTEAYFDRLTKDRIGKSMHGLDKVKYCVARYSPYMPNIK